MTTAPAPDALAPFHPAVADWFARAFEGATPPQVQGWPHIAAGEHTLIVAPTGSGKTLAAFLAGLDALTRARLEGHDAGRILYISPLKALNYDVERNLRGPLAGIAESARRMGLEPPDISVGVRTGDTPQSERQRMLRNPPDILITTPESLYLLLTSKGEAILEDVSAVIVDEIHAMAGTKRGSHLALSLERLERVATRPVQRIGLSATVHPIAEVARFLVGTPRVSPGEDGLLDRAVARLEAPDQLALDPRHQGEEAHQDVDQDERLDDRCDQNRHSAACWR